MMHPNFYHWHNRAELKPDPTILQARWDAAEKFTKDLKSGDACSLLRLALFGTAGPEFAKRFSGELVALEPTFLPEGNAELLRVMATAALCSRMEKESVEADAVALGLLAAAFQPDRIQPVSKDLMQRSAEYLATESERMRPTPNVEGKYQALKKAVDGAKLVADPEGIKLLGNAILELGGDTMRRISEENQFLWWLLGRRSSLLNTRREKLSQKEYAFLAGAEAADRVTLLPPPASVESLIDEVLTHCAKASNAAIPLTDYIDAANIDCLKPAAAETEVHELCPLTGLLGVRREGGKVEGALLERLNIPVKLKVSPTEAASQYFRELMFFRALAQLD